MAEPIHPNQTADIAVTNNTRVVCDGTGALGHPRVFLTMVDDAAGQPSHVVCPYCSKLFRYQATVAATA